MDLKKLSDLFPANDIEWRIGSSGEKNGNVWAMCLAFITNRAIMERLDSVCGPGGWKNEFKQAPEGGILCGISIKVGDEWVTKWDGASNTQVEAVKGGLSGAMKRAGVQWGIGRYLYKFDANFANVHPKGKNSAKTKSKKWFKWDAPNLPKWAIPTGDSTESIGISEHETQPHQKTFKQLMSELNADLTERRFDDKQKDALTIFYCSARQVPIPDLSEAEEVQDFIMNLDRVIDLFNQPKPEINQAP